MNRRRGPDGKVAADLFGREVAAWRAWAAAHGQSNAGAKGTGAALARTWQERGPFNIAGRVMSVALDPTDPNLIWAGSAGGGLWKSADFGQTWRQTGGDDLPSLWIGAIAVDPNDHEVVYMGTGEDNTNYGGFGGFGGMLKTTDGGQTFSQVLLPSSNAGRPSSFLRTIVSRANSRIVLTASDVGVYRSGDAGSHFTLTTINDEQNISDLDQDPDALSRFVAVVSGGYGSSQSGLLESLDAGVTWHSLGSGLPDPSQWGRSAFAFGPAGSGVAFTAVGQKIGGSFPPTLFKSTDHGHTWTPVAVDQQQGYQGVSWYGAHLAVAPWDVNTVFQANGGGILVSHDGGVDWTKAGGNWHVDTHGIALTPLDRTHIVFATDGGVAVSTDGGATFNRADQNFRTVQYYSCAIGLNDSVTLFGGTQDNCMNAYRGAAGGSWEFTYPPGFCDDGGVSVNPTAPAEVVAVTAEMAGIGISEDVARNWSDTVANGIPKGEGGAWDTRIARSATSPLHVYLGGHYVDASSDGGHNWVPLNVRPDLEEVAEDISVSPASGQEIWSMWNDAKVFVSEDGGATWHEHSPPSSAHQYGNRISAGPVLGTAYAVLGGSSGPRLFRTHDAGYTWTDIGQGLPDLTLNALIADPRQAGHLILSTDAGIAYSADDGQTWQDVSGSLPKAVMWDLCLDPASGRLAVATYGRGIWEFALPQPTVCTVDATTACLLNGRFRATLRYRNGFDSQPADTDALLKPVTGFGSATYETVFFYFNDPNNIEVLVKMLDQGNVDPQGNPTIAVLFGTATPLHVELTITDTTNGQQKVYTSPFPSMRGGTDFTAFRK